MSNIGVNLVLGLLYYVDVSDAADVSEVHDTSIFKVEVRKDEFLCIHIILSLTHTHTHILHNSNLKTESACISETSPHPHGVTT
jgi:hypothetical protein